MAAAAVLGLLLPATLVGGVLALGALVVVWRFEWWHAVGSAALLVAMTPFLATMATAASDVAAFEALVLLALGLCLLWWQQRSRAAGVWR